MALVDSTVRAAFQIKSGEAVLVVANVSALSKGMLRAMLLTRLKLGAGAAIAALASAGMIVLAYAAASEPRFQATAFLSQEKREAPIGPRAEAEAAEKILAGMAEVYSGARSYQDEGVVTLVFINPNGRRRTEKKPFATKFVRPNLFRYEFWKRYGDGEGENDHYVIWSDAAPDRSRSWWTITPELREGPLASLIAAATGVSSSSSRTVPSLLMPGPLGRSALTSLKDPREMGAEVVDEVLCDKIEGKDIRGNTSTVWIDQATGLVRKILSTSQIPGAVVEQTTTYRPRVNIEIAPEHFVFEPPKP
jgi:hypothetical protein